MIKRFPSEEWKRRVIVVLEDHDIERLYYEGGGKDLLLNDEVAVLKFPVEENNQIVQSLLNSGYIRPGLVLTQNPYNRDKYEEADEAIKKFAVEKQFHFTTLCMLLGAKEVYVKQVERRTEKGTVTLNVETGIIHPGGSFSGSLDFEKDEMEKFTSELKLKDKFSGGKPNIESAEKFLQDTALINDPNMKSLLEICKNSMQSKNAIKKRELTINLTSEAKKTVGVLAKVKFAYFLKISTDYEKVVKEKNEYSLTLSVDF